jgi:hypothetical protein
MKRVFATIIISGLMLAGCSAHRAYEDTRPGKFEGVVDIRWLKPDRFLYVPSRVNPLRFTTPDGRVFEPKPMYTDGGSVPRLFWSVPGYSPWGIGPAYIIHDWLFMAHHCNAPNGQTVEFAESAQIMGEAIKSLMEKSVVPKDETVFFNVVQAVKTPMAKRIWDKGACDLPSEAVAYGTAAEALLALRDEADLMDQQTSAVNSEQQAASDPAIRWDLEKAAEHFRRRADQTRRAASAIAAASDSSQPATQTLFTINVGDLRSGAPGE